MNDLTFDKFQQINAQRCREAFDENLHDVGFFCIAIAGETGEMCNEVKKALRGDYPIESVRDKVLEELADVITYCDLMITKLGGNTEIELIRKFNKVSERRNCEIKL
jgi:NTP pyrophosphatase (non-canonical NTP hydrolase)